MFRCLPVERIGGQVSPDWGLDEQQVIERRQQYGTNDVIERPKHQWLELFQETLLDPMIWFLVVASILFALIAKYSESIVLLLAILPIGGMDAFLHWRTQVSTRALSSRLVTYARVIREGKEKTILAKDLVPGDLLCVKAGEYIAADGAFVAAQHVQVDESSLTGEAFPASKKTLASFGMGQEMPQIDYAYWGFVGTRALTGSGLIRVVYTGKETLYGEIIGSVLRTQQEKTPLQKALAKFVLVLIEVALVFCVILAMVRSYQGFGIIDALLSATTLAVVALPDEFPMVFTFFLGVGVYRLAKKHVLVRRSVTVENIGRINCICTDKTGTITEGRFHIIAYVVSPPYGEVELLSAAANASRLESGDPLDLAILAAAEKQNIITPAPVRVFPFTEDRKCETTVFSVPEGLRFVTKGAPETVIARCHMRDVDTQIWQDKIKALGKLGHKVIACAEAIVKETAAHVTEGLAQRHQFLGLIAFADPPRPGVVEAVRYCQQNKIHVLMVTGDHPDTAQKIAADIGLGHGNPRLMTATEIEVALHAQGPTMLRQLDVIARAVPSQKFAIVKALQNMGNIVAVTGDGVNDVPALRAADIGIAMGERGTQSAREAAAMVLLDDNFDSIVNAIREGKQLFHNLQLSFKYLLMVHAPYVVSATIVPLLGYPLLYFPIHIVVIELFIHPTCMLVFQNLPSGEGKQVKRQAQNRISFFSRYDWAMMMALGTYTSCLVVFVYFMGFWTLGGPEMARANAFAAIGTTHIALTIGLSRLQSFSSRAMVFFSCMMLLILLQVPPITHYFNMQPPTLFVWMVLGLFGIVTGIFSYLGR